MWSAGGDDSSSSSYSFSSPSTAGGGGSGGGGEIMLFGVRVKVDPMRKSVSLNNLSQYEQPYPNNNNRNNNNNNNKDNNNNNEFAKVTAADHEGYASADDAVVQHQSNNYRERKRGVPWTEEEHKLFLLGLQKVGKGDWRGISRNFVKTRTPTQVASHAQKYFLRRSNLNRRRRRSSLFDITTDSVSVMPIEDGKHKQEITVPPVLVPTLPAIETTKTNAYPMASFGVAVSPAMLPAQIEKPIESSTLSQQDQGNISMPARPVPMFSVSNPSTVFGLNLNQSSEIEPLSIEPSSLSLRLSLSLDQGQESSTRQSAFRVMSSFRNGENIISVA